MSKTSNLLRGITNEPLKQAVKKALDSGFELGPMTGTTHCSVVWPETGEKVGFGTTVSDRNYFKSFIRQCERVSGLELIEKHKRGKTSKKSTRGEYIVTYKPQSQTEAAQRLDQLTDEYRELGVEFRVLTMAEATRDDIQRCFKIVRRLSQIQEVLRELHQPIPDVGVPDLSLYEEK